MLKFTVKRENWLRGGGEDGLSGLLIKDKMCCLGFYALACGAKPSQIRNKAMPSNVAWSKVPDEILPLMASEKSKPFLWPSDWDSKIAARLAFANDSDRIGDTVREKRLKKLFALIGVRVDFE